MIRYAITDCNAFPGNGAAKLSALLSQARRLAHDGVEYLQLREKELPIYDRVSLAMQLREAINDVDGNTRLMFNGPPSLASLAGADGVHLPGNLASRTWRPADFIVSGRRLIVSVSCHSLADVQHACQYADVVLYAPVFEKHIRGKKVQDGLGLEGLREACLVAGHVPVLALGGVTDENVGECLAAGAAGMAGIRPFLGL